VGVAAAVTVTDALIAFPIAFYMAKLASRRARAILIVAILLPLWSSYLVKVLSWRTMLSSDGVVNWVLEPFGLDGPGFGITAVWLVMSYLWLPYMILPIYAGLERIPDSLISASEDLGASPFTTFRRVILPLSFPAVVAGSIFTFSLTLGDYITPRMVSNDQFIGNVIFNNISNNLPLASALAMVPIVVMIGYLLVARKLGAFEHV
jgi:putative spermidine/putrescine transport system permease protein